MLITISLSFWILVRKIILATQKQKEGIELERSRDESKIEDPKRMVVSSGRKRRFGRIFYWVVWERRGEEGGKRKGKGRDRKGKGRGKTGDAGPEAGHGERT